MSTDESTHPVDPPPRATPPHLFQVPGWLDRSASWAWRLLLVSFTVIAAGWLLLQVRVVVVPVFVAVLVAALLGPPAAWLRDRSVPGLVATWGVLLGAGLVVVVAIGGALALIADALSSDTARWRELGDDLRRWLTEDAPVTVTDDQIDRLWDGVRDSAIGGLRDGGIDAVRIVAELLAGTLLGIVLVFFFVNDGARMWSWVIRRLAPQRAAAVDEAGRGSIRTLNAYLRGLAITGVVDAVIIGLGLWVLGVPLAFPLALLTFFGAFIPIVGATAAGAFAAVVALVFEGPTTALLTVLLVVIVQQVEGDVVMPLVMRRQVALHPAVILLSVACGAAVAGLIGAFLAVPVAAVAVDMVATLRRAARSPDLVDGRGNRLHHREPPDESTAPTP